MSKFYKYFLIILLAFVPTQAKADYFVWQDAHVRVSLTFPDTWHQITSSDPGDALTIMAPSGRALAQCRLRIHSDRRHLIHPAKYNWAVQKIDFSMDFWEQYMKEYTDPRIHLLHDGAGIGRGYSSYIEASYKAEVPGPEMDRKSIAFVSQYYDKNYVLECSSHRDAFDQWKSMFLSIAKSLDFNKTYHEAITGDYRNFFDEPALILSDEDGRRSSYY